MKNINSSNFISLLLKSRIKEQSLLYIMSNMLDSCHATKHLVKESFKENKISQPINDSSCFFRYKNSKDLDAYDIHERIQKKKSHLVTWTESNKTIEDFAVNTNIYSRVNNFIMLNDGYKVVTDINAIRYNRTHSFSEQKQETYVLKNEIDAVFGKVREAKRTGKQNDYRLVVSEKRSNDSIIQYNACFIEMDLCKPNGEKYSLSIEEEYQELEAKKDILVESLLSMPLPWSYILRTKNGIQAVIFIDHKNVPFEKWNKVESMLVFAVNTYLKQLDFSAECDSSATNAARLFRMPCSVHYKTDNDKQADGTSTDVPQGYYCDFAYLTGFIEEEWEEIINEAVEEYIEHVRFKAEYGIAERKTKKITDHIERSERIEEIREQLSDDEIFAEMIKDTYNFNFFEMFKLGIGKKIKNRILKLRKDFHRTTINELRNLISSDELVIQQVNDTIKMMQANFVEVYRPFNNMRYTYTDTMKFIINKLSPAEQEIYQKNLADVDITGELYSEINVPDEFISESVYETKKNTSVKKANTIKTVKETVVKQTLDSFFYSELRGKTLQKGDYVKKEMPTTPVSDVAMKRYPILHKIANMETSDIHFKKVSFKLQKMGIVDSNKMYTITEVKDILKSVDMRILLGFEHIELDTKMHSMFYTDNHPSDSFFMNNGKISYITRSQECYIYSDVINVVERLTGADFLSSVKYLAQIFCIQLKQTTNNYQDKKLFEKLNVEVEGDNSYNEIINSMDDNNSQADFVRRELLKLKEWSKPSNEAKALFKSLYTHFMTAAKKFGIEEKELRKLFEAYKIAIEMALPMGAKFVNGCFKDAKFVFTKNFLAEQLKITSMTAKHRIAGLKALGLIQPVADHKLGGYKKTAFYQRRYGVKSYRDDHNRKRYYVDGTEYYQLPDLLFENPQLYVEKVLELYVYLKEEVGKTCFWNIGTRKLEEYLTKWEAYIEEQLLSINMPSENAQESQEEVEMKETIVNVYEKYMTASNQEINEKTKYHDALLYMQDVISMFRCLFARAAASSWILDDDLAA